MATVTGYSGSGVAQKPSSRPADTFDQKLAYQDTPTGPHNEFTIEGCGDSNSLTGSPSGIITVKSVVSPGQFRTTGDFVIEIYKDSNKNFRIATSANLASGVKILDSNMRNTLSV